MRRSKLCVLAILFLSLSCANNKDDNVNKLDFDVQDIENGFLICRLGNGYFSNYFRKFASKEQKYSHIGIISIENDSVFVYHSEASEFTGVGFVKRESINIFLNDIGVYDFYKLSFSDSTKTNILNTVKCYYQKKTPFDLYFDSFNDNELYCTELIATSMNKNVVDSIKILPTLILNGNELYSLDDIYKNKNVKKVSLNHNGYKL